MEFDRNVQNYRSRRLDLDRRRDFVCTLPVDVSLKERGTTGPNYVDQTNGGALRGDTWSRGSRTNRLSLYPILGLSPVVGLLSVNPKDSNRLITKCQLGLKELLFPGKRGLVFIYCPTPSLRERNRLPRQQSLNIGNRGSSRTISDSVYPGCYRSHSKDLLRNYGPLGPHWTTKMLYIREERLLQLVKGKPERFNTFYLYFLENSTEDQDPTCWRENKWNYIILVIDPRGKPTSELFV